MSRITENEYNDKGYLVNGFDYVRQAWVQGGRYVRCGHPEGMACNCWGRNYPMAEANRTAAENYAGPDSGRRQ